MKKYYFEGKLLNTPENREYFKSRENLEEAKAEERILEAPVSMCDKDHNLHINMGCMSGIIPRNEGAVGIDDGSVRDIALISRVGKPVQFIIEDFITDEYGLTKALLSRKKVQEMCAAQYTDELRCGDIIEAKITHLERFGAFVDLGAGVNSLIPIDMLSISRISHPSQRVREGDEMKLVVRSKENGKITLSLREMLGTWEENAAFFTAGETVQGIVRSIENYGIFIELAPNLAGLAEYNPDVRVSQIVSVYIKAILPEKMKIKLSIIDVFGEEKNPCKLKYFFDGDHMDFWRYSPEKSEKLIETDFMNV
jgi:small subunit ribosomal protein S1